MGNGASQQLKKRSRRIDKALRSEYAEASTYIKLLLLGTGECGKSTLARQMKVLKLEGFNKAERRFYKVHIQRNLAMAAVELWKNDVQIHLLDAHDIDYHVKKVKYWLEHGSLQCSDISLETALSLTTLLQQKYITRIKRKSSDSFHLLPESSIYFFEHCKRICEESFEPSDEDIRRCRIATTSIQELTFDVDGIMISLIDVGGQRGQRKKWITQFDSVRGVIFVTSLPDYYKKMEEDGETNRMTESLQVFREIARSKCFLNSAILIFFNKKDLMPAALEFFPFSKFVEDYSGDDTYDHVTEYIKGLYLNQRSSSKKEPEG